MLLFSIQTIDELFLLLVVHVHKLVNLVDSLCFVRAAVAEPSHVRQLYLVYLSVVLTYHL